MINVYELRDNVDYHFIQPISKESFLLLDSLDGLDSFGTSWKPFEVELFQITKRRKKLQEGDFLLLVSNPVFSENAFLLLKHNLDKYGEFLPIYSTTGHKYFIFNIIDRLPALDKDNSLIEYFDESFTSVQEINSYSFYKEVIENNIIFRIPESRKQCFVTDKFVELIEKHKLKGFEFTLVWSSDNTRKIGEIIRS